LAKIQQIKWLLINSSLIKSFITSSGRVLCLRQDSAHFTNINSILINPLLKNNVNIDVPGYPVLSKSPRNGYYVNTERLEHPVFAGIQKITYECGQTTQTGMNLSKVSLELSW
jgi:hypothetical protein